MLVSIYAHKASLILASVFKVSFVVETNQPPTGITRKISASWPLLFSASVLPPPSPSRRTEARFFSEPLFRF